MTTKTNGQEAVSASPMPIQRYLTVAQAAHYLGRTVPALYHLAEEARIPFRKAGGRLLFDIRELDRWVAGLPGVSTQAAVRSQPGTRTG